MTEESQKQISADEVALYDRQIRLWGMDAQNRMRNSKILLINLGAIASEIAKNVVLAGIGSLTVLDSHLVSASDLGAGFFLRDDDIGKNRAHAAKDRIQLLNKRVEVKAVDKTLEQVEKEWISGFDVVVATELGYQELVYVNNQARAGGKYFYATGLIGMYGYVFADLIEHQFKIERNKANKATVIGPENDHSTILSSELKKDGDMYIETVTKTEKYRPLNQVVETAVKSGQFGSQFRARKLLRISPVLPALLALWDGSTTKESILKKVHALGLPAGIVTDEFVTSFQQGIGAELAPVAAIIGGVLGQDILNVLAQKGTPIQNLLLFNGDNNEGPIYTL